jgi:hypothetical protein
VIRTRVMFIDGIISEGQFFDMDELSSYIKSWGNNILTLEVDVESSDNNRPAFWCEE